MLNALSFFLLLTPTIVEGHGYMYSPRSRNWVAYEDGTDSWTGTGPSGVPAKEYCYHCLNGKAADEVCGQTSTNNYDDWLDTAGTPIPWDSQAVYTEGEIITVKSYLSTNHKGHMDLFLCKDDPPTQDCFEANPLEFVEDLTAGAPKDFNYSNRGYYAPMVQDFEMKFKLPTGITGDRVMMQYRYVTGNSCVSPGYLYYPWPDPSWLGGDHSECVYPLDPTGARCTGCPEQFWNCAEITIVPSNGQPSTPAPTIATPPAPSVDMPSPTPATSPSPTQNAPSGTGCCTWNPSLGCEQPENIWCQESQVNCEGACSGTWLASAPAPTNATPSPTPATTPSPTANTPSGIGCCTKDFKTCSATLIGRCSESQLNCEGACDKWWLPNGEIQGCVARYESCSSSEPCCSPGICTGDASGYQSCQAPPETPTAPTPPTPQTTPAPAPSPSTPPISSGEFLSCTANAMTSVEALAFMDTITYEVSTIPYTLSIVAEGGAAGSGGSVVSEGQGYGIMASAIALASLGSSDTNRDGVMEKFYGYFNGWKQMCINSSPAPCQHPMFCNGGSAPCLPGWKHRGDLLVVEGTGAAPDGDEDAIVGMIIALKAVENDPTKPSWYDEVRKWTDESCTQFLKDNTKLSTSKSHRLLKLGSCWGGWNSEGNNPSYASPGAFRAMRDFHISYDGPRSYTMPSFDDSLALEEKWNMLIDTSYKFYTTTQCTDTGLVPNWALVKEVDSQTLAKQAGSFSGSGTPQYEFGAEASRTMWRVAFDAILYPEEAKIQTSKFLEPIHTKLRDGFTGSEWLDDTLQSCSYVDNVFPSWRYNGFIFGPVYSTLAVQSTSMSTQEQQTLVNSACSIVKNISGSYYARSWHVISMMTLNGDVRTAGVLLSGEAGTPLPTPAPTIATPSPSPAPTIATPSTPAPTIATPFPTPAPTIATPSPTPVPTIVTLSPTPAPIMITPSPTPAPTTVTPSPTPSQTIVTPSPTPAPTGATGTFCCAWGTVCSNPGDPYCDANEQNCVGCGGSWIDPSSLPQGCCTWNTSACGEQPDNTWCHAAQANCEGACSGTWLVSS